MIEKQILWFASQFGSRIDNALSGTPFTVSMLTAIAYKETGYLWSRIRRNTNSEKEFLEMCVGDSIGSSLDRNGKRIGRSAFPRNKQELIDFEDGVRMFKIARRALENVAEVSNSYSKAAKNPDKFCRGYGVFQYDLQFFKNDSEYFLKKHWNVFERCLDKVVQELKMALKRAKLQNKSALTVRDQASVAIAYNSGKYISSRGLKQGHRNRKTGIFYGEEVYALLQESSDLLSSKFEPSEISKPKKRIKGASAFVSTDGLNLRKSPNGKSLLELTIGDPLIVHGASASGKWLDVTVKNKKGVVFARYVRPPAISEVEDLLQHTIYQWLRFDRGRADEKSFSHYKLVGDMWKSIGRNYDGRSVYPLTPKQIRKNEIRRKNGQRLIEPRDVPWSAAFVSHVVAQAGAAYSKFAFSSRHSEFCHDAIQAKILNRSESPFWGYRRRDLKPRLGDIVQRNRAGNNFSYDYAEVHSKYESHSDIVVEVQKEVVRLIGGNVKNSVRMVEYKLNKRGYIARGQNIICVLKNRAHLTSENRLS